MSVRLERPGAGSVALIPVALAMFYVFPYSQGLNNPNERTRVLQARAIAEFGQLHIGRAVATSGRFHTRDLYGAQHRGLFVNDVGLVCEEPERSPPRCSGRLYPAKAPGVALLGAPWVALGRALGWVAAGEAGEAEATWAVEKLGVTLPLLICLWLWVGFLRTLSIPEAIVARAVLATGLGTTLLAYGTLAVGHVLAGGALMSGIALAEASERARARSARAHPLAVGALAGHVTSWAVLLEYHALIAASIVGLWALFRARSAPRRRFALGFGAGAAVGAALHLSLHQAMFGNPLRTGHTFLASAHNRHFQSRGFLGIDGLHADALSAHLIDLYMGLIPFMPWLAFGMLAALWGRLTLGDSRPRGALIATLFIILAYLLFASSLGRYWAMNGWSVGPRYLGPAILPMATLATLGWALCERRAAGLAAGLGGLAAASVLVVSVCVIAFPSPPQGHFNTFGELAWPHVREGYGVRNLGQWIGLGTSSIGLFLGLAGVAAAMVALPSRGTWRGRAQGLLLAAGVAASWTVALANWPRGQADEVAAARAWMRQTAEGVAP